MQNKWYLPLFLFIGMMVFTTFSWATDAPTTEQPVAFLPESVHAFKTVVDGTEVLHDFVITNKGNALLKITRVNPGWGCTAVSFTREIPPGGEGKITIKVKTNGFGGRSIVKNISVYTNEEKKPQLKLTIKGTVEKFATIQPKSIRLTGVVNKPLKQMVHIIPRKEYPFNILEVNANKNEHIKYALKKETIDNKLQFVLSVENIKKEVGRYFDRITLKTDSKIKPKIEIRVFGNIYNPVSKTSSNKAATDS